jgi:hypothetical protein
VGIRGSGRKQPVTTYQANFLMTKIVKVVNELAFMEIDGNSGIAITQTCLLRRYACLDNHSLRLIGSEVREN